MYIHIRFNLMFIVLLFASIIHNNRITMIDQEITIEDKEKILLHFKKPDSAPNQHSIIYRYRLVGFSAML